MNIFQITLVAFIAIHCDVIGQLQQNDHHFSPLPVPKANERVATFAGGCFWSLAEAFSELHGVSQVVAGYAGGSVKILRMSKCAPVPQAMQSLFRFTTILM